MKIFIIGPTKSGKSTIAHMLRETFDFHVVQMSAPLKNANPRNEGETYSDYISHLVEITKETLAKDPDYFANKAIESMSKEKINIIEGLRNPRDFSRMYNPKEDVVIWLRGEYFNNFEERGIEAIYLIVEYFESIMGIPYYNYKVDLDYEPIDGLRLNNIELYNRLASITSAEDPWEL